jgi:hypothetical protein
MKYNYGSPFVNENSGRVKTDRQNEQNIQRILVNFLASPVSTQSQFKWIVKKKTLDMSRFGFPVIGFVVMLIDNSR